MATTVKEMKEKSIKSITKEIANKEEELKQFERFSKMAVSPSDKKFVKEQKEAKEKQIEELKAELIEMESVTERSAIFQSAFDLNITIDVPETMTDVRVINNALFVLKDKKVYLIPETQGKLTVYRKGAKPAKPAKPETPPEK